MDIRKRHALVSEIYLIRHGETAWSKSLQHTGQKSDLPLTRDGEKEAKALHKRLKRKRFDHVFISPLQRVQKTSALMGFDKVAIVDDHLLEWDYGAYEGLTTTEIQQTVPHWNLFTGECPGGESLDEVSARADSLLYKLIRLEGRVLLVSSGHISRVIASRWLGMSAEFGKHLHLGTASLSILGFEHDYPTLNVWNDQSHLR